jgi:regulatory protein
MIPSVLRKPRKLAREELFQYAVSLLSGRALSTGEVRRKLTARAADAADIEPSIARLREYGFVDDEKFAEGYASVRRDSGSFGSMRVLRDLRQRSVSATVAEKAVTEAFVDVDESKAVAEWLARKYRSVNLTEHLQDPKHLASAYRKLRYAGFTSGTAIRVLKRYASRADELEDGPED